MKKRESDCKEQRYIRPEKRKKRIVVAVILIVVIVGLALLYMAGCPRFYSDEMHQRRISRKFQKEYVDTGIYTDFKVYPLYDIDDNIIRYLIETEPANHFYVRTQPNYFFVHESLYLMNSENGTDWFRYRSESDETYTSFGSDINWGKNNETGDFYNEHTLYELEDGAIKYRSESPFAAAGIDETEFRYMLFGGLMPAVKRNGVFVNLISMCEMSESELRSGNFNYPYLNDARIFAKSYYL